MMAWLFLLRFTISEHIYLGKAGGPNKPGMLYSVKAGSNGDITPADSGLVSNGVEWTLRQTGVANSSPLLFNGLIYLLGSRGGEFYCLDAATGATVYKAKALTKSAPVGQVRGYKVIKFIFMMKRALRKLFRQVENLSFFRRINSMINSGHR